MHSRRELGQYRACALTVEAEARVGDQRAAACLQRPLDPFEVRAALRGALENGQHFCGVEFDANLAPAVLEEVVGRAQVDALVHELAPSELEPVARQGVAFGVVAAIEDDRAGKRRAVPDQILKRDERAQTGAGGHCRDHSQCPTEPLHQGALRSYRGLGRRCKVAEPVCLLSILLVNAVVARLLPLQVPEIPVAVEPHAGVHAATFTGLLEGACALVYGARAMRLTVNGEARDVPDALTVRALIEHLGLVEGPVAVELNREVVPRARHESTALAANDVVEIVHFVGGG